MSTPKPPRRRVTIIEVLVVAVMAAVVVAILVPLLRTRGESSTQRADLLAVQEGVRRYYTDTRAYPSLATAPMPDGTPVGPWNAGSLPSSRSNPGFAGIDFRAVAIKVGADQQVQFFPDYLKERPKHAGETADDGIMRWRLDSQGNVHVEMDGRTY